MKRAHMFSFKAMILIAGEQLTLSSECLTISLRGCGVCVVLSPSSFLPHWLRCPRHGTKGCSHPPSKASLGGGAEPPCPFSGRDGELQ